MTKRAAHNLIYGGTLTWGDLKHQLDLAHHDADGMSAVNPGLTKQHALDILTLGASAHEDAEKVDTSRATHILIATNILRECDAAMQRA